MSAALYRLLSWLSPSYPVGAYSYSHGLEYAVETGLVHDRQSARNWVADILQHGAGRVDGILLTAAFDAAGDGTVLRTIAETGAVFVPTRELALESHAQGAAFLATTLGAWPCVELMRLQDSWDGPLAYPIAVGVAAAGHGVARDDALVGYLHAFAANLVSAAMRLVPLGQSDGQAIVADLEAVVAAAAEAVAGCTIDDLSSSALMVDWASAQHETQYTRLFRS